MNIKLVNSEIDDFFAKRHYCQDFSQATTNIQYIYQALNKFFFGTSHLKRLSWCNGGAIPGWLIFTCKNFHLLNNISIVDAFKVAYPKIRDVLAEKNGDIKLWLRTIYRCGKLGIEQEFLGGLFLLYCELCEKVKLS